MTFWTGFATGLAKSVDQGLQKAMTKRDDELSRAKSFWQTRQAQKLDQKEKYDARAEKALKRLIRETGSSTLGLAAFNAAGGDADGAEDFLKQVDATRNAGETYNIRDNLKLPEDYKAGDDIEESAALKSVRMQMKGIDATNVKIDDPLSKFGLGLKDGAAQSVADEVNSLIEPEIVETLNNIPNVTIDRSGFVSAIDRQRQIKNNMPGLEKQLDINAAKLLKLDKTAPNYEDEAAAIEQENSVIYLALANREAAKDTSTSTGLDFTKLLRLKTDSRTGVDDDIGWTPGAGGSAPYVSNGPNGTELSGPDAVAYRNEKQDAAYDILAKSNLLDSDGAFLSKDAEAIASGSPALIAAVKRTRAAIAASKNDGKEKGEEPPKPKIPTAASAGYDTEDKIKGDLSGFVAWKVSSQPTLNTLKGLDWMSSYLTGLNVSPEEIAAILDPMADKINADAAAKVAAQAKAAAAQAKAPKYSSKKSATKAKKNAPIPLNKLLPGSKAHSEWIATYGKTHNPDGTPK